MYSVSVQGLQFEVVPSWFKETLDKALFKTPYEYAVETAKHKALEVAQRMPIVSLLFLFTKLDPSFVLFLFQVGVVNCLSVFVYVCLTSHILGVETPEKTRYSDWGRHCSGK